MLDGFSTFVDCIDLYTYLCQFSVNCVLVYNMLHMLPLTKLYVSHTRYSFIFSVFLINCYWLLYDQSCFVSKIVVC